MTSRNLRGASRRSGLVLGWAALCVSPHALARTEAPQSPGESARSDAAGELDAAPPRVDTAGAAEAPPGSASVQALEVHLVLDATGPSAEAIRRALEAELDVAVHLGEGERGLHLTVHERQLRAEFVPDEGERSERRLTLPAEEERQLETIALLAGNLVRDEAGELLARLRRPEPVEVPVAPPPSPAPSEAKPIEAAEPEAPRLRRAYVDFTLFSPASVHPDLHEREVSFTLGALYTELGRLNGVGLNAAVTNNQGGGQGVQLGGFWSSSWGAYRGVRMGGLVEAASGGQRGVQIGGLVAYQRNEVQGLQIAGIHARAGERSRGSQVSPINVAGEVEGIQIGLVNYASGRVNGAQLGLVNIGHGMRGAPIGLVNVNPDVRVQALAWASARFVPDGNPQFSSAPMGHVGVKYTGNHFYSLIGLGLGATEPCARGCVDEAVLAPGFGLGAHLPLVGPLYADLDGYYQWEISARSGLYGSQAVLLRAALGLELTPALAVFAGAGPRLDIDPNRDQIGGSPHFFAGIQLF